MERVAQDTSDPPNTEAINTAVDRCILWLARVTARQLLMRENQARVGPVVPDATAATAAAGPNGGANADPPATRQEQVARANRAIPDAAAAQEAAQQQVLQLQQ